MHKQTMSDWSFSTGSLDVDQKLENATRAGDLEMLHSMMHHTGQTFATYRLPDCSTLLHVSAAHGPATLTKKLLETGIDVNARSTTDGSTALHIAASAGRLTTVELLLEVEGVDDTIRNNVEETALDLAQKKPVQAAFRYARSRFVDAQLRALYMAVQQNDPERLVQIMANSRARHLVDPNVLLDNTGETVLHRAVRTGKAELVKACLQIGSDPFAKNRKGKMPIEMTQVEAIRQILKDAPMISSQEIPAEMSRISGYLMKYVNFASGYKRRYAVLEDGILSYFKSKEDYPVSCKGSVNVQFARLVCPPGDRTSFELCTEKYSLYFKTDTEADASRWILALGILQKNLAESGEVPHQTDALNAALNLRRRSQAPTGNQQEYLSTLRAAHDCLNQLETHLIRTNGEVPSNVQSQSTPDTVCQHLLQSLHDFFRLCDERENYWQARLHSESRQRAILEESLRRLLRQNKREMDDPADNLKDDPLLQSLSVGDEFFDALDEVEYDDDDEEEEEKEDVQEQENGEEHQQKQQQQIESHTRGLASTSEGELQIGQRAVPEEDLAFIRADSVGYSETRRNKVLVESTRIPPISIWNIVKNAIGKDLTRIPIPVNFSEPISMLQRLCEDLEYADLLYMASISKDPLLRLQYVMAFAISPYSSSDGRISKPFNPILGETYEYVSHEHGFRYISEQVSHHPPISACHCESERYIYHAEVLVKTKFWGKSLELLPDGLNHVYLKTTGEHFSYRKVTTGVYNIIMGKMWLDHYGVLRLTNHTTGEICEVEFKPTGWRAADPKRVEGTAYNASGEAKFKLEGYWNLYLQTHSIESGETIELWRRRAVPPWSSKMYNFTYFSMTLNELNPELQKHICRTDSRLRPDQRAMEEGAFDEANDIKILLEERQRAKRRTWEAIPDFTYKSRWFQQDYDTDTGENYWKYMGGYWEARSSANWEKVPSIYFDDGEDATVERSLSVDNMQELASSQDTPSYHQNTSGSLQDVSSTGGDGDSRISGFPFPSALSKLSLEDHDDKFT